MIDGRADRLKTFVSTFAAGPVVWGKDDCSAAPTEWLRQECGIDVALPRYRSREEAQAVVASFGGLSEAWRSLAIENGLNVRYGEPELGDIGVIDTRLYGEVGGILASGRVFLVRKDSGGWHAMGPIREFAVVFAAP